MDILSMLLASGSWVSAYLMISSKNPVYSVFYLVLVFLHLSGLLCLMGLEYFLLLQLLVYVGLLLIMFLFVVMLLHIPATEILAHQRGSYPIAGLLLLSFLLAFGLAYMKVNDPLSVISGNHWVISWPETHVSSRTGILELKNLSLNWLTLNESSSLVAVLGRRLYLAHIDLLLILSLLLLIAMVGLVALTLKRRAQAPIHDVFVQHSVDFQKVVYMPVK